MCRVPKLRLCHTASVLVQIVLRPPWTHTTPALQAAWTGIPHHLRPRCWRLLLRYEPPSAARAAQTLQRRRREYADMAPVYYDIDARLRSDDDLADLKQARPSRHHGVASVIDGAPLVRVAHAVPSRVLRGA